MWRCAYRWGMNNLIPITTWHLRVIAAAESTLIHVERFFIMKTANRKKKLEARQAAFAAIRPTTPAGGNRIWTTNGHGKVINMTKPGSLKK